MYALFILVDLIKNGFPEKQISVISKNVHLAGDLMFDGEELLKLYRIVMVPIKSFIFTWHRLPLTALNYYRP